MRSLLLLLVLLLPSAVAADELPDAGLPDASVGEGGAERMSEESDPGGGPCLDSKTCSKGFSCVDARCVPTPIKTVGCSSLPAVPIALALLAFAARRRRR